MLISILKKISAAGVSVFIISLAVFLLSKAVPGDPVEASIGITPDSDTAIHYDVEYGKRKEELNLHLPYFYFAILPAALPPNINTEGTLAQIKQRRSKLIEEGSLLPKLHWYGSRNQYHRWLFHPSNSLQDGKPASTKIGRSLVWTCFLVLMSITLSYAFAIVIGISLSSLKRNKIARLLEGLLFGIYAIPVFWLATLMLVFFTTNEYGTWTNIFPSVGLTPIDLGERWYVRLGSYGSQLILPCLVLVLHNLAFLSMLTKRNIDLNRKRAFTTTSRAYGFTKREILYREVLPMSLLPLITSVTSSIPAAIGGSLVVEIIFNIPGMGRLLYTSILSYDWPVVFPIVLLIACITFISYMLADVFYKIADPRIR